MIPCPVNILKKLATLVLVFNHRVHFEVHTHLDRRWISWLRVSVLVLPNTEQQDSLQPQLRARPQLPSLERALTCTRTLAVEELDTLEGKCSEGRNRLHANLAPAAREEHPARRTP